MLKNSLQAVFFQKMAKVQDGRFVRHRICEQIHVEKFLKRIAIIDGFFCSGIAQVVPLLEEVDLEKLQSVSTLSSRMFLLV